MNKIAKVMFACSTLTFMFFPRPAEGKLQIEKVDVPIFDTSSLAAEAKLNFAQGKKYLYGEGVAQDDKKAFLLLSMAAENGCVEAEYYLGKIYRSREDYDEAKKAYKKAFSYFTKFADRGNADAQYLMGEMNQNREGVSRNKEKAFEWFEKAAEQGHPRARSILAKQYFDGITHKRDWSKVIFGLSLIVLFIPSAINILKTRNPSGVIVVMIFFVAGGMFIAKSVKSYGIAQDFQKAKSLSSKAAWQGDADAQQTYGEILHGGLGVQQDNTEALKWFILACGNPENTNPEACIDGKRATQSGMTPAQIGKAEKLAIEFTPQKRSI